MFTTRQSNPQELNMNSLSTKGVFLFDIEVELAWGIIDKQIDRKGLRNASEKVREHLDNILFLLNKYSIPVTWGIVGHLILSRCESGSGMAHPEMPRPSYSWKASDWYENDPCKTLAEEPAFYGKDVVDTIVEYTMKTQNPEDIACHSFSHQIFGDPGCNDAVAEAEVKRCSSLLKENYGIHPRVFIFPRDSVGHLDVLRKEGYLSFRGPIPRSITYSETDAGILTRFRKNISLAIYLASFYASVPPPVVSPRIENELVNVPASLCYNKKPFIALSLIVRKAKKGIDRAIKEKKIFHLYTHLINLGVAPKPEAFIKGLEDILAYANSEREEKKLDIMTLHQLAESHKRHLQY